MTALWWVPDCPTEAGPPGEHGEKVAFGDGQHSSGKQQVHAQVVDSPVLWLRGGSSASFQLGTGQVWPFTVFRALPLEQ